MRYYEAILVGICLSAAPAFAHAGESNEQAVGAAASEARSSVTQSTVGERASHQSKAATDDKARYQEREATSSEAQNFRGGDTIVIGTSAVLIVLDIVVLVVLL